jgi:hypothetical protein
VRLPWLENIFIPTIPVVQPVVAPTAPAPISLVERNAAAARG